MKKILMENFHIHDCVGRIQPFDSDVVCAVPGLPSNAVIKCFRRLKIENKFKALIQKCLAA